MRAKAWSTDEALDYVERGDWDNAIRSFEEALDKDPDDEDLQQLLESAKAEKARGQIRPALKADADPLARVPELQNSPEAVRIRRGHPHRPPRR